MSMFKTPNRHLDIVPWRMEKQVTISFQDDRCFYNIRGSRFLITDNRGTQKQPKPTDYSELQESDQNFGDLVRL